MTVKTTEYGKAIWVASGGVDLSSYTELELVFTAPTGGTSFTAATATGVAIGTGGTDPGGSLGTLAANYYVVYTIPNPSLFDVAGEWKVALRYTDGSNSWTGDCAEITIGNAACS